jgi:hypothetical protein
MALDEQTPAADQEQDEPANAEEDQDRAPRGGSEDEQAKARQDMERMEEADEVPSDPRDWPDDRSRFLTFGDPGDRYGDGATAKLGPAEVVHHAGGSVSVGGEKVDNPEDFKGEPIPGGPTDPNSPDLPGEDSRGDKSEDAGDDDKQ